MLSIYLFDGDWFYVYNHATNTVFTTNNICRDTIRDPDTDLFRIIGGSIELNAIPTNAKHICDAYTNSDIANILPELFI